MLFFFSELMFKIIMVVSFKMETNMYRDLRSECASQYPETRAILPSINTFPDKTVPRQI